MVTELGLDLRVCALESKLFRGAFGQGKRSRSRLFLCSGCSTQDNVDIYLHVAKPNEGVRKIYQFEEFKGKSCFDIFHHERCAGLWMTNKNGKVKVRSTHPVYKKLKELWNNDQTLMRSKHTARNNESLTSEVNSNPSEVDAGSTMSTFDSEGDPDDSDVIQEQDSNVTKQNSWCQSQSSFPVGRCCIGRQCLFPNMELRPTHKCKECNKIVHAIGCSKFLEVNDGNVCLNCV